MHDDGQIEHNSSAPGSRGQRNEMALRGFADLFARDRAFRDSRWKQPALSIPANESNIMRKIIIIAGAAVVLGLFIGATAPAEKPPGGTYRSQSGTVLRLLIDESNMGPEASVGEITFPPNLDSGDHKHGSIEMFYVVSGELEHVVNGQSQILRPGMAGYVKPPDTVRHKTGPAGAKAVVIWVPGDEAKKITSRWTKEP